MQCGLKSLTHDLIKSLTIETMRNYFGTPYDDDDNNIIRHHFR